MMEIRAKLGLVLTGAVVETYNEKCTIYDLKTLSIFRGLVAQWAGGWQVVRLNLALQPLALQPLALQPPTRNAEPTFLRHY